VALRLALKVVLPLSVAFKVRQAERQFVALRLARKVVLPWSVAFKVRQAERQFVELPSVPMVK
jgi:hypothetical protein